MPDPRGAKRALDEFFSALNARVAQLPDEGIPVVPLEPFFGAGQAPEITPKNAAQFLLPQSTGDAGTDVILSLAMGPFGKLAKKSVVRPLMDAFRRGRRANISDEVLYHATTREAAEKISREGFRAPSGRGDVRYAYTEFGPGNVYAARKGDFWLDAKGAAKARAASPDAVVPLRLSSDARVETIESLDDFNRLAKKADFEDAQHMMRELFADYDLPDEMADAARARKKLADVADVIDIRGQYGPTFKDPELGEWLSPLAAGPQVVILNPKVIRKVNP